MICLSSLLRMSVDEVSSCYLRSTTLVQQCHTRFAFQALLHAPEDPILALLNEATQNAGTWTCQYIHLQLKLSISNLTSSCGARHSHFQNLKRLQFCVLMHHIGCVNVKAGF